MLKDGGSPKLPRRLGLGAETYQYHQRNSGKKRNYTTLGLPSLKSFWAH